MSIRVLIIEDEDIIRDFSSKFLTINGFDVESVKNGREGLEILSKEDKNIDCVLLDLNMPDMTGDEMIIKLKTLNVLLPPIIILSGYIDADQRFEKCIDLGMIYIVKKPCELEILQEIIKAIITKSIHNLAKTHELAVHKNITFIKNPNKEYVLLVNMPSIENSKVTPVDFEEVKVSEIIKKREDSLKKYFLNSVDQAFPVNAKEPLLVIGRRWNSWYPSYFNVKGGAYSVVGPLSFQKCNPVALIDPGFKFLETLRELGISVNNMENCVITHNHPDHIGGIFEYIACRNTLGHFTQIFCNPTVGDILQTYNGNKISIQILDEYFCDLLNYQLKNKSWQKIEIRGFKTSHKEVGVRSCAQGIVLSTSICSEHDSCDIRDIHETIILGDTEYDPVQHKNAFIPILAKSNVKILVLHIGSCQIKARRGGHLYLEGLQTILNDINSELNSQVPRGEKLLVLISEWGLEHAKRDQLIGVCDTSTLNQFDNEDIITIIIDSLKKQKLNKLNILPADIGLTVGMNSGKIYLDAQIVDPEKVKFKINREGIGYYQ